MPSLAARTYVGVVSHVIDDALQHGGQCHHGVGASAVDGLVWFLEKKKKKKKVGEVVGQHTDLN